MIKRQLIVLGFIAGAPASLTAQAADSTTRYLREFVDALPTAARLRVKSQGKPWIGRLTSRSGDSLVLENDTGPHSFPLVAIDSLWVRAEKHEGLLVGAGLGAIIFSLAQISRESGGDRAESLKQGALAFLGAAGAGMLIDAVSDQWSRRYPE